MVYFFREGTFYLNPGYIIEYVCCVSCLDLCLQPGHDSAAVVELALQITTALALILAIQCKGNRTDMLEEKISAGQAEIY